MNLHVAVHHTMANLEKVVRMTKIWWLFPDLWYHGYDREHQYAWLLLIGAVKSPAGLSKTPLMKKQTGILERYFALNVLFGSKNCILEALWLPYHWCTFLWALRVALYSDLLSISGFQSKVFSFFLSFFFLADQPTLTVRDTEKN